MPKYINYFASWRYENKLGYGKVLVPLREALSELADKLAGAGFSTVYYEAYPSGELSFILAFGEVGEPPSYFGIVIDGAEAGKESGRPALTFKLTAKWWVATSGDVLEGNFMTYGPFKGPEGMACGEYRMAEGAAKEDFMRVLADCYNRIAEAAGQAGIELPKLLP